MDKQYSVQFFTSLVESIQKCCRDFLEFDQAIELSGYLNLEIDNFKKERYVLSEMITNAGDVISESYCTKAFKTVQRNPRHSPSCTDSVLKDSTNHFDRSRSNMIGVRGSPAPQDTSRTAVKRHFGSSQRHYVSPFHPGRRRNLIQSRRSVPSSFTQSSPSQPKNAQPYEIQARSSMGTFPSDESIPSTSQGFSSFESDSLISSAVKTGISSVEDSDHSKEKSTGDLEALYAAATSVSNLEQSEFTPVSSIYSSVSQTNAESTNSSQSTGLESVGSSYTALPQPSETIRLPVTIKEEDNDDDDDVMFIESPDDMSASVSGQSASIMNTDSRVDISHGSLQGHLTTADGQTRDGDDGSAGADMKNQWKTKSRAKQSIQELEQGLCTSSQVDFVQIDTSRLCAPKAVGSIDKFYGGSNVCEFGFESSHQLQSVKVYQCSVCAYETNRNSNLIRHSRVHTGERFTCHVCGRSFINNYELRGHLKMHSGQLKCSICDRHLRSMSALNAHMSKHKPHENMLATNNITKQRLKMMAGLEQRVPVKLDPQSSNFKWLSQSSPNSLYHTIHTGIYGQAGSLSHDVYSSMSLSESDVKGNEYQSSSTLKMYRCDLCGYEASRNYNLTRHMRTHTGDRLRCPLCDRTFIDNYKLKYHLKSHTNVMTEPSSEGSHVEQTDAERINSLVSHGDQFRNTDHHSGPS